MDIFNIQTLISQNKIASLDQVDPDNTYVQVGIYQKGFSKKGSGNANVYPAAAMPLSEILTPAFQYEIGEYVPSQGGVIVHRWLSDTSFGAPKLGKVQNYIVVDTNDLSSTYEYSNVSTGIGATAQSPWNGLNNTNAITSQIGSLTGAAVACNANTSNGFTDWYLPSMQELGKIWYNYFEVSQGLESAGAALLEFNKDYWSSTEYSITNTRGIILSIFNDRFLATLKNTFAYVRAVRRFSI